MSDPTLDSLALLDDPSRFRCVKNVPIFKPHVRKDAKGEKLYEVKADMLPEIARRTADLEKKSGVVGRIGQGHIKPGQPQKDQPPLFGYFRNAREGTFGPSQEPAILADYYVRVEKWDEFKDHPYRSAEFYPGRGTITGVASLKTDPELDLGVLVFEQDGEPCYHYAIAEPVQYAADPDERHMEMFARCMKKMFPHLERMHSEHAERYGATGPGTPGSTNVMVPKMSDKKPDGNPVTLEALQEQFQAYQRQAEESQKNLIAMNKAQGEQIQKLERQNQVATYERELEALHRDFVFDMTKAKERVQNYSAEQFAAHKADVMENYQRRPHTVPHVPHNGVASAIPAGAREATMQEQQEAIQFATRLIEAGQLNASEPQAYELCERAVMLAHDKGLTNEAALAEVRPQRR